jgi:DNA repair exonuclease SbcCD ATPase subunit
MAGTEITVQERYELLQKLTKAVEAIKNELEDTKNKLTVTTETVSTYNTLWNDSVRNYEKLQNNINAAVQSLEKQIAEYKEETDRFKQYSKSIDENLEIRFTYFKERLDNFNKTLEIIDNSVKAIREIDLERINERIVGLPSLESIRKELSDSTSPLVTKDDFRTLENKVSHIEGAVSSHFRNSLISLFIALATIIATNVVAYYTFVSKVDSNRSTATPQSVPPSLDTAAPSP